MFKEYKSNVVKLLDQVNDVEFLIHIYTLLYLHVFGRDD